MTCTRYISFTHKDAERNTVSVYVSRALDVEDDSVWHPKSLHEEVIKNVGYWNFPSGLGGKVTYFTENLMLPSWENYNTWQAQCLNYFVESGNYDVIFSHLHNVDGIGHAVWAARRV